MAKESINLSAWALKNLPLTRYLMAALMVLGIFAYFNLGQDEDPPFAFRAMVIGAYWPGATAEQVSQQLVTKLESTLQEINHADKIISYAKPNEALITFFIKDNFPAEEVPHIWYQVRKKIGDIKDNLPAGVIGPFFNDEFGDVYGVIYGIKADGFNYAEQKKFAQDIRQQLLRIKDVAKVELFGVQEEKLYIEISQEKLATMGLPLNMVLNQINAQSTINPAGIIKTGTDKIQLRVQGQINNLENMRQIPIQAPTTAAGAGKQIKLSDIANIYLGYEDPPSIKVNHNGEQVIAIGVSMAKGGDVIALGKALEKTSTQINQNLPAGVELSKIQNQPEIVKHSINEFIKVLIEAVSVVLLVSFLSLGLHKRAGNHPWYKKYTLDIRPGLVVAITIPLVLSITFLIMYYFKIGLDKISLGSLIIALGLLVDDAIIAVEMMVRKMEEGYDKLRAATFAYELTAKPMLTGTLITAVGFLPIGMAKSSVGEYTFSIFAVTVIALLVSWIASVIFVPVIGSWLLKIPANITIQRAKAINTTSTTPQSTKQEQHHEPQELFDTPFYNQFRKTVTWCVTHHKITIAATIATFTLGMIGMTGVQQQFFPDSNRPEILIELHLAQGTEFIQTEKTALAVQKRLQKQEEIGDIAMWIGKGVPRFYLPLEEIFPQTNVAQLIVTPKSIKERDNLKQKLPQILAQEFPEARARVKYLPSGPPVAYPVQFRVIGENKDLLRKRAEEVKTIIRQNPHAIDINDNWGEWIKSIKLEIDQTKARAIGISSQAIAQTTYLLFDGIPAGQYRKADEQIQIILRRPITERQTMQRLKSAYITTNTGKNIPLMQIAKPILNWEAGVIWRHNHQNTITVNADTAAGIQGATISKQLIPQMKELEQKWSQEDKAAGINPLNPYKIETAGTIEESGKGIDSIKAGIPVMLFISFTLLMLQLASFGRSMLVFLTGPLGMAGVAGALLISGRPFGFVALLGVVALMGMIQRNSVILIDQIEIETAKGISEWDATIESAVRRLRPIVLTAAAAVLAMIPLARSDFWGPMAVAIMGGLIVATALTLLALPAMYVAWFGIKPPPKINNA